MTPKDSFAFGMAIVVFLIFAGFGWISYLEVQCEREGWPSISSRIEGWSKANPWFAAAVLLVLFMLLAHFVLNPLFPPPLKWSWDE